MQRPEKLDLLHSRELKSCDHIRGTDLSDTKVATNYWKVICTDNVSVKGGSNDNMKNNEIHEREVT